MPKVTFLSKHYDREIFVLALPALGALAADPLVSLVDTAFVGRLGALPLGALGVNASLFSLAFFVFNFLAYGTTPLVGRAVGRGDVAAAGRVINQALVLAVGLGLLALVLLELSARPLLVLMGATTELQDPALSYLRIRALAAPAVLIITAANGAFRGFQDTRTPLVITLWLNAINLVLDPLLIFGLGWGIAGAAIATTVAQWTGALLFLRQLLITKREVFGITPELPPLASLLPFLKIGWDLFVRTFALIITLTLATAIATRLGVLQVAAHQVAAQLWLFLALTVDALAIAAQALVAKYLGESKGNEARAVANRLLFLGLLVGAALGVAFWLLRPVLPRFFTTDETVIATVLELFIFIAFMQPLNALVFVWDGIFVGREDFGYLAKAMLVSSLTACALLFLVIPLGWGLTGVWWAIVVFMLMRALTLALRYWRTTPDAA